MKKKTDPLPNILVTNAFWNPGNGTGLTNTIDVTAHSISSLQEETEHKTANDIFIPQNDIAIAEPIDVQMD